MLDSYPTVRPGPPRPSQILTPEPFGVRAGLERFEVPGGGAWLIALAAGDRVTVVNLEGGQRAELVAADDQGRVDPGILGASGNSDASGLKALLTDGTAPGMAGLRLGIERRGINLSGARAVACFGEASPAGDAQTFIATRDGVLIIAAPGAAMRPEAQDTSDARSACGCSALPCWAIKKLELPDPLATPVLDLRVKSATAESYFVKAGDYIQIIDVEGRQCTDFQCFSARKLDKGLEHPLDVTTSRTLMGHAYSMPGLHAKYYDQDWLPLVEVIQDTVGRHDAFAMACAAKYYDEIGYPGHVNCSDNFNAALAPHGVHRPPRLDGGQPVLQHQYRRAWRADHGRAVVAAR